MQSNILLKSSVFPGTFFMQGNLVTSKFSFVGGHNCLNKFDFEIVEREISYAKISS